MFSALPLALEIVVCFIISLSLLHRYSDFLNHNAVTIGAVLISWFFSFLVIFLLPADLTSTAFRQCLHEHQNNSITTKSTPPNVIRDEQSVISAFNNDSSTTIVPFKEIVCNKPWNYVGDDNLKRIWRFIYWSSQFLTWIVLPLMQSYSMAGDFTRTDKLKSSLRANLIYYSSFGAIFTVLLIYMIIHIGFDLSNLKVIIITSANTWGLFLLVILLGYGLIELPRSIINKSLYSQSLNELYFKVARVNAEKCEAEAKLDDVLEEIHQAYVALGSNSNHVLRPFLDKIVNKCPPDWKKRSIAFRRQVSAANTSDSGQTTNHNHSIQSMISLHSRVKSAVHYYRQITCKWISILKNVYEWEDVAKNQSNTNKSFIPTVPRIRTKSLIDSIKYKIYTPQLEWYWKCFIRVWIFRLSGCILALFSLGVVWSEVTFLFKTPVLSIFALFVNGFQQMQDFFLLEVFSFLSIGYLASCAFYTVFNMKLFNIYYLASNHQTDEYSLIFSGLLLCRLAVPICLNYLCLVHRDYHIIRQESGIETSFTAIMGHLDLIPFVNNGLNIFLPLCISAICLALYFNIGTYLLHQLGFEQYIEGDELTGDYVRQGRDLVKREKAKLIRSLESSGNYCEMISSNETTTNRGNAPSKATQRREVSIDLPNTSPHASIASSGSSQSSLLHKTSSVAYVEPSKELKEENVKVDLEDIDQKAGLFDDI